MGEVTTIDDDRRNMTIQVGLIAVGGHPGTTALGGAHIEVE